MISENVGNKLIAFNGVMGCGKTTQARLLAQESGSILLLGNESKQPEIVSGEIFTQGSDLEVEKWFVNYHLGKLALFDCIPERGIVSDMSLPNDLVIGRALLKGDALRDFEKYYNQSTANALKPDNALLFLLPPEEIFNRVQSRLQNDPNRQFESSTEIKFIDKVQSSFMESYRELGKNVSIIDLRQDPKLSIDEVQQIVNKKINQL